jgi:hypothetical protein
MVSNPQRVTSWRGVRFTCRQEAYVETPYYDGVMKLAVGLANRRGREQYLAREGYYGEIDRFGVYAGSPLVLVEYRPFPKDDET